MQNSNLTTEELQFSRELLQFINESPSPFHTVESIRKILEPSGFTNLNPEDKWSLTPGGKYFVTRNNSAIIAFVVGSGEPETYGFHLIGAHTDSPSFRVKPQAEILQEGYLKLNVETYGGPILNTWLDRPLSLAGRVILRGTSPFCPQSKLFRSERPLLVIPNLAIHMNRKVNEGIELNKQKDLLPLMTQIRAGLQKEGVLIEHLAETLECSREDILDFDLFLYNTQEGCLVGLQEEFISSGRLDDLAMVHAGVAALTKAKMALPTQVLACFDNEECGSTSKQGAASPFLANVLSRILLAQEKGQEAYFQATARSFFISADMAHALHPNSGEKHDPTHHPALNGGPVIKYSANQSYTTDAESAAVFIALCQSAGVAIQKFVNRSDERGGSTIGPISSTHLDWRSVDIGNPILAMHSVRELGGVKDHLAIAKVFTKFYETP
ncbi:M18 family aminopeptidase [Desulfosporosinus sp. PR]|uniref:M18 family aminopeptidase n=1 Tax=Candidatus Desulfosporosinus nitrosoreducens TaxID=3401928 RepID=UPI0027FE6022|nr:M18 family aminopeptidase [Desulfosporosinus sp. PR]MDQ7094957.1 M18 family aminopeptidase [Desulfosporosinus sp. PR]